MTKLKSAKHHWWPECVSRHWAAKDGKTGRIEPDGSTIRIPPKELGAIGNGHHIKFGRNPGDSDVWDSSFEKEFDAADTNFPGVISWLNGLSREAFYDRDLSGRFVSQPATDKQLLALTSPMNREASVALAESLRGPLPNRERNLIIGVNMQHSQRIIVDSIRANAKFAILFSTAREFIYGDGFFHNVRAVVDPPHSPRMLVPITPTMSVIISRPTSFFAQPRLSTLVLTADEVSQCNHAVQVYSRQALFFRSQEPSLIEAFTCCKHMEYESPDNPVNNLINAIPGTPLRNTHWF
jgi:hypothetical protein